MEPRTSLLWVATVVLLAAARGVSAQEVPNAPKKVDAIAVSGSAKDVEALTSEYLSGDWQKFLKVARPILNRVHTTSGQMDLRRDHVLLLWIGAVPASPDPVLLSAVLAPGGADAYSRVLPGIGPDSDTRLWEVAVTAEGGLSVASYYVAKPVADPLLTQVADVAQKFVDPLFSTLNTVIGSPSGWQSLMMLPAPPPAPVQPTLLATVRGLDLPEARSGVEGAVRVSTPLSTKDFMKAVDEMATSVRARGLAEGSALDEALKEVVTAFELAALPTAPACGQNQSTAACRLALHRIVSAALAGVPDRTLPEIEARRALEGALRVFVDALKPTVTTGTFKLDNAPLTRFSFGILSSFTAWGGGEDVRAKISDNKIAADPASRALQMVVLNLSPWGYQSKSTRRWNKRAFVRPFAGVVFSPDVGLGVGVSFMVLSNFGANVGYANLLITQPAEGLELDTNLADKLPANEGGGFRYGDELRRDPLRRGTRHAVFLGFSYNFK